MEMKDYLFSIYTQYKSEFKTKELKLLELLMKSKISDSRYTDIVELVYGNRTVGYYTILNNKHQFTIQTGWGYSKDTVINFNDKINNLNNVQ